jgi:hypothetical protein
MLIPLQEPERFVASEEIAENLRFGNLTAGVCAMNFASPFFVVSLIVVIFVVGILFATSSKEDGPSSH